MILRVLPAMVSVLLVAASAARAYGQTPAIQSAPATAPSTLVQPSLATLQESLARLHPEHWKMSRSARDATIANLASIHRDLDTVLPPLLASADAAPASLAALLPVSRNLGALYDVLLRVTVIAEGAASTAEIASIDQALTSVEGTRQSLSDRLNLEAVAEADKIRSLESALDARPPASTVSTPPPCTTPRPHHSRKKRPGKPIAANPPNAAQSK